MKLAEKFEEALIYATRAHGNQTRKKTEFRSSRIFLA